MTDLDASYHNLRIATRKSPLALWQAHYIKSQLEKHHPSLTVELIPMVTKGDILLETPLAKVGGKGLFIKELEVAILEDRADIAVHSMKDVPIAFPEPLGLVTICQRHDPRDAFVSHQYNSLADLPEGAIVGTCSLRRHCQLQFHRPDLVIKPLRGNVGTRLQKLDDGHYDAIILAAAGLLRLELGQRIKQYIAPEFSLPAAGQGAIGIEARLNDPRIQSILAPLNHQETHDCVTAERAMNIHLEGGCQVPIGSYAQLIDDQIHLAGLVGQIDKPQIIQAQVQGPRSQAAELGISLAKQLLAQGAQKLLDAAVLPGQ